MSFFGPMVRTLAVGVLLGAAGCMRPLVEPGPAPPAAPPAPAVEVTLAMPCTDAGEALVTPPKDLPPFEPAMRGDVIRCAIVGHVSLEEAAKEVFQRDSPKLELSTGFTVIRLVYRARRANGAREASSPTGALVLLPDTPRGAVGVVYAHGTVGLADRCAPSRAKTPPLAVGLAAAGFTTIAPDYAGFGFHGATHGWMDSDDESRSLFDAARALVKLLPPERAVAKLVLVGHSQGGHAVLAAQSAARAEDLPAPLVAVFAIAPMWFPSTLFASIARDEPTRRDPGARDVLWSLFYFHGHGELFDGPGGGALGFKHERRGQLAALLDTRCASDLDADLKGEHAADLYDRAFTEAIATCLANRAACSTITRTWAERMRSDQPAPDRAGAPVVFWAGGRDENMTPGRTRCALDHLRRSGLGLDKLTVCVDPRANHRGVLEKNLATLLAQVAARGGALCRRPGVSRRGEPRRERQGDLHHRNQRRVDPRRSEAMTAKAPEYELYYWPSIQGRGEFVRLAFEDAGVAYRDVAREPKGEGGGVPALLAMLKSADGEGALPFAPPILKHDAVIVSQTAAILAYLGPRVGLVPDDEGGRLEALQHQLTIADVAAEVHDTHHPIAGGLYYEDQKPEALRRAKEFTKERIPKFLGHFERALERNHASHGKHLVHRAVSYADLSLFQLVAGLRYAFPKAMNKHEPAAGRVVALHDAIANRPRVAAYLKSKRRLAFNEDGIFRHYPELDV